MKRKSFLVVAVIATAAVAGFFLGSAVSPYLSRERGLARLHGHQLSGYRDSDEGYPGVFCIAATGTDAVEFKVRKIADGNSQTISRRRVVRDYSAEMGDMVLASRVDREGANSHVFTWISFWGPRDSNEPTTVPIPPDKRIYTTPASFQIGLAHLSSEDNIYVLYHSCPKQS